MLNNQQILDIEPRVKVMRILIGALMMGIVVAGLLLYIVREPPKFIDSFGILTIFGIAMAACCFLASYIVPSVMRAAFVKETVNSLDDKQRKQLDGLLLNKLLMGYQTVLIIRCALIEGAVFANLLFWLVEGSVYNFAVAGIGLILMAFQFPFSNTVVPAVEDMFDSIQRDPKLGT